jgi:hypothetical protein
MSTSAHSSNLTDSGNDFNVARVDLALTPGHSGSSEAVQHLQRVFEELGSQRLAVPFDSSDQCPSVIERGTRSIPIGAPSRSLPSQQPPLFRL